MMRIIPIRWILTPLISVLFAAVAPAVPSTMNVQGRLTDSTGSPIAAREIILIFKVFSDVEGEQPLWPSPDEGEQHKVVTDQDGLWNATIGSYWPIPDSIFADTSLWLEVTVDDGELSTAMPRLRLHTGPYAFRASWAKTADTALAVVGDGGQYLPLAGGTMTGPITNVGNPAITMGAGSFGSGNTNTGASAFVAGQSNEATGDYSVVSGGINGVASSRASALGGGENNVSGDYASTIGGGADNVALDSAATVGGGRFNRARGPYSTVAGGGGPLEADSNSALGHSSAIGGGIRNSAGGMVATVSGGFLNAASGSAATVGGGSQNAAASEWSTVAGGNANVSSGHWSSTGGGLLNVALDTAGTVAGGYRDSASAAYATVGGGRDNTAAGYGSTVSGGLGNSAASDFTAVGGGENNEAPGEGAAIGGGRNNIASGDLSVIAGGGGPTPSTGNAASGSYSGVVGGLDNEASGSHAFLGGGRHNIVSGNSSFVGGGQNNTCSSGLGAVCGGANNNNSSSYGFIGGGSGNTADGLQRATVCGGGNNRAGGWYSVVSGGASDTALGTGSMVPGGGYNLAFGDFSLAAGFRAKAWYHGSFVWADSNDADFASTAPNQFLIRARGGVGINNNAPNATLHLLNGGVYVSGSTADAGRNGRIEIDAGPSTGHRLLHLRNDNGVRMIVDGDGGVGIGTTTTDARLRVEATDSTAGKFQTSFQGGNAKAVRAECTGTGPFPSTAVYGRARPADAWGRGGHFIGGADGVVAEVFPTGDQIYRGVFAAVDGGGGSGVNYGIWAQATGNGTNYAGWFAGDVNVTGQVCAANIACPSDERLKTEVSAVNGALSTIGQLRGTYFQWSDRAKSERGLPEGEQLGLLAQEVQDVVPQAVVSMPDGYLAVDYARLVPLLIEAVKELKADNEDLRAIIEGQKVVR